jgi:hypothetical protein
MGITAFGDADPAIVASGAARWQATAADVYSEMQRRADVLGIAERLPKQPRRLGSPRFNAEVAYPKVTAAGWYSQRGIVAHKRTACPAPAGLLTGVLRRLCAVAPNRRP